MKLNNSFFDGKNISEQDNYSLPSNSVGNFDYQSNLNHQTSNTFGQSIDNSIISNFAPAPVIRHGLSVQELKVITARRMAYSGESPSSTPAPGTYVNPAGTYQTACKQQLEAVGILPVVLPSPGLGRYQADKEREKLVFGKAGLTPPTVSSSLMSSSSSDSLHTHYRRPLPTSSSESGFHYSDNLSRSHHPSDPIFMDRNHSFMQYNVPQHRQNLNNINLAPINTPPTRSTAEGYYSSGPAARERSSSLFERDPGVIRQSTRLLMEPPESTLSRPVDEKLLHLDIFNEIGRPLQRRNEPIFPQPLPEDSFLPIPDGHTEAPFDSDVLTAHSNHGHPSDQEAGPYFPFPLPQQESSAEPAAGRPVGTLTRQHTTQTMPPWIEEDDEDGLDSERLDSKHTDRMHHEAADGIHPSRATKSNLLFPSSLEGDGPAQPASVLPVDPQRPGPLFESRPRLPAISSSASSQSTQLSPISAQGKAFFPEEKDKEKADPFARPLRGLLRGLSQSLGLTPKDAPRSGSQGQGPGPTPSQPQGPSRSHSPGLGQGHSQADSKVLPPIIPLSSSFYSKPKSMSRLPPGLLASDSVEGSLSNRSSGLEGSLSEPGSGKFSRWKQQAGHSLPGSDSSEDRDDRDDSSEDREHQVAFEVAEFAISSPFSSQNSSGKFQTFPAIGTPDRFSDSSVGLSLPPVSNTKLWLNGRE